MQPSSSDQLSVISFIRIRISENYESVSPSLETALGHSYRYHRKSYIGLTEIPKVATFSLVQKWLATTLVRGAPFLTNASTNIFHSYSFIAGIAY